MFGSAPAPSPFVSLLPICSLIGAGLLCSACRSVLATMNSTPSRPPPHHAVDGVAAAAADANHLDPRAVITPLFVQPEPQSPRRRPGRRRQTDVLRIGHRSSLLVRKIP